jgi:uncharacterized repeat protein (TIGR03943 family)
MIARHVSFFAPAAVMSAWGTVMLHTFFAGRINELLSPMFRSYVLIGGVVLVLLSIIYVVLYQPSSNPAPALAPTGRLRQGLRWLVLLLPVVAACVLSPAALSNTTFQNRSALNSTAGVTPMPTMSHDESATLTADPSQPVPVEVTDLITLGNSPAQMKAFAGRSVHTVGLIVAPSGATPKLVRWIMWCCAADAQPASVELTGNLPPGPYKDSQWYDITGTAQFPSTLGRVVPQIEVTAIKPTVEPDEPYLSP